MPDLTSNYLAAPVPMSDHYLRQMTPKFTKTQLMEIQPPTPTQIQTKDHFGI